MLSECKVYWFRMLGNFSFSSIFLEIFDKLFIRIKKNYDEKLWDLLIAVYLCDVLIPLLIIQFKW